MRINVVQKDHFDTISWSYWINFLFGFLLFQRQQLFFFGFIDNEIQTDESTQT